LLALTKWFSGTGTDNSHDCGSSDEAGFGLVTDELDQLDERITITKLRKELVVCVPVAFWRGAKLEVAVFSR